MTDDAENLVLEHLRRIRASQDGMEADFIDVKHRLSAVETNVGQVQVQLGMMGGRIDRVEERLARIERRLDLVDV